MCVCTYVRMYVSVNLRNVNLHSRSGTQASLIRELHENVETTFFGNAWRGRQHSWALQHMYLAESNGEMSAECSQLLATLRKKKSKKSVHSRSQESKKRTRKSWKHVLESLHKPGISSSYRCFVLFFGLPLNQQHTISDTCSVCPTCMCNAHRHTGAWWVVGNGKPVFDSHELLQLLVDLIVEFCSLIWAQHLHLHEYLCNEKPMWMRCNVIVQLYCQTFDNSHSIRNGKQKILYSRSAYVSQFPLFLHTIHYGQNYTVESQEMMAYRFICILVIIDIWKP